MKKNTVFMNSYFVYLSYYVNMKLDYVKNTEKCIETTLNIIKIVFFKYISNISILDCIRFLKNL